ncbi:MAG: cytochrome C oxidase Cbb3 [Bacteroidetes bacterium MedPE-SWsnd-G1]|nr:MAG: cytochrome C oxidase Cbb3 [Bacteroidetes bacterium MedPE-SWsnd-G1]
MKINWGTSIVIAFALFISFILFFVIKSHNPNNKHDLVSEEYYKDELKFQDEIDKQNNVKNLEEAFIVQKISEGIEIQFPSQFTNDNILGVVIMARPSNKALDFETVIQLNNNKLLLPKRNLVEGNWNLKIEFSSEGTPYLYKKSIKF